MEKPRLRKVKLLQKVVSETMFLLCAFCCLPVCELWWKFVIIISTKLEFCACWYLLIRGRLWSTNTGWLWYDPGPPHPEIGTIIACNVVRLKYSLFPQTCCVFYALTFNALPGFFFFFFIVLNYFISSPLSVPKDCKVLTGVRSHLSLYSQCLTYLSYACLILLIVAKFAEWI